MQQGAVIMKKRFFAIVFIPIFSFFLFSAGCSDKQNFEQYTFKDAEYLENREAYALFSSAFNKWKSSGIKSYYMKLKYSAFSPLAGTWQIWVKNCKPVRIISNKDQLYEQEKIKNSPFNGLTMEFLFKVASNSYKYTKTNLFKIAVEYNEIYGHITYLWRYPATKEAPKDQDYSYKILEFEIIQ